MEYLISCMLRVTVYTSQAHLYTPLNQAMRLLNKKLQTSTTLPLICTVCTLLQH